MFEPEPVVEPDVTFITADDIGTLCVYDPSTGTNPTNQCGQGLTCLIYTRDAVYTPFSTPNQPVYESAWEDHTTVYRSDGMDEGYCTFVYPLAAPTQVCPDGSFLRQFMGGFRACIKLCNDNQGCRAEQVCDFRYLDVEQTDAAGNRLGHCVRPCEADAPDCVRSGLVPTEMDPEIFEFRLAFEDLIGASVCNQAIGRCEPNSVIGTVPPGGECTQTEQCAGTLCLGPKYLGLPDGASGFCAGPCQPAPMDPFSTCSAPGYVCQEGLKLGYDPFVTKVLGDGGDDTFGGWCFPACNTDPSECDGIMGASCGQADTNTFQSQWNGVSMCMIPSLLGGT